MSTPAPKLPPPIADHSPDYDDMGDFYGMEEDDAGTDGPANWGCLMVIWWIAGFWLLVGAVVHHFRHS